MNAYKKKGFGIGLLVFILMLILPAPDGLSSEGWMVAAVVSLMAIWWATETIPVAVTALIPLALFPIRWMEKRQSTWARGNMMSWLKLSPQDLKKFLKKIK